MDKIIKGGEVSTSIYKGCGYHLWAFLCMFLIPLSWSTPFLVSFHLFGLCFSFPKYCTTLHNFNSLPLPLILYTGFLPSFITLIHSHPSSPPHTQIHTQSWFIVIFTWIVKRRAWIEHQYTLKLGLQCRMGYRILDLRHNVFCYFSEENFKT